MRIQLKATWTSNASLNAPDECNLVIRRRHGIASHGQRVVRSRNGSSSAE
jgi:hypothetical protein